MSEVDEEDDECENFEFSSDDENLCRREAEDTIHHPERYQVDNPVVDLVDDPALAEIDDRDIHTHALRRHVGAGAGSSRPISARDEPIKLLMKDIKEMQTNLLRVMQDNTLNRDKLRKVQGQLSRMKHALMDILEISFAPPKDVPDDSKTDDDPDD
ncbi:hypothetical protein Syun_015410 [Stephania yunnanensis]|uniref:Uncharacterized protein n=1 Tax=Stephania yunnanensis TaxID=152371 RepID=A0AAP0JNB8_9MAGN